ncbi:MAG: hypothetical protein KAT58_04980 [candidate division Zixibacteria bacterium]|nr:hypothetical protein [candidate division Zixibacteria bacterium]
MFTKDDIEKIKETISACESAWETDHYRLKVVQAAEQRSLVLEIYPDTELGEKRGALVVVYTGAAHLQLHNCSGYVASEELGEVTFIAETADRLSGLVVEREAACSLYSQINRDLISSDFSKLGVEVMLSGVALSLAEEVIDSDENKPEE